MPDVSFDSEMTMAGGERTLLAGRYRIVRQLGQGGMGSVWLAEDIKLDDKLFAIKMLPAILVNDKRAYLQLKSEALVAMKLTHPNIVNLRAFEENDGNPFLVMDYVDGQTLGDYLAEKGTLTEEETVALMNPVAAALDYAHAKNVVHRDIKPGNIMIAEDGTPYILDFGIAREMQETMTRVTGKLSSGTLLYMSPEQLNGDPPKPSQDIYSFAAMVYECLKGDPPFSRGQIEHQILNNPPKPLPGGVRIAPYVMRGLSKTPESRPCSCVDILSASCQSSTPKSGARAAFATISVLAIAGCGWWFMCGRNHTQVKLSVAANSTLETALCEDVPSLYVDDAVMPEPVSDAIPQNKIAPDTIDSAIVETVDRPNVDEGGRQVAEESVAPVLIASEPKRSPLDEVVEEIAVDDLTKIEESSLNAGDKKRVKIGDNISIDMVWCPAGTFMMGSPTDEESRARNEDEHTVTIGHGFWLGRFEVSQALWSRIMGQNPSQALESLAPERYPVDSVSWDECIEFVSRLNKFTGTVYFRLPTEAEWEYACRAGTCTAYSFGNRVTTSDMHVRGSRLDGRAVESGTYRPNAWGIYDMHGNLAEWCCDCYNEYGKSLARRNRGRVLRGGSWKDRLESARSAARNNAQSSVKLSNVGLRLCFSRRRIEMSENSWQVSENTRLAIEAFDVGNWSLGFACAQEADMGNADIQEWLGRCYDPGVATPGLRVKKDVNRSQSHYYKAKEISQQQKGQCK